MSRPDVYILLERTMKAPLTAIVGCSWESAEAWIRRRGYEIRQDVGHISNHAGRVLRVHDVNDGAHAVVLWVKELDWTVRSMGVLVHELKHAADFVAHDKGVDDESGEFEAYVLEFYFTELCTLWNRRKRRREARGAAAGKKSRKKR